MNKLKLAYFGTPDFAASFLEKLLTDKDIPVEVSLVVTQPDAKAGRKQIITPTPVKVIAQKYGVEVVDENAFHVLRSTLHGIDLALVYAFGEIIPENLLTIPKYDFWNVHPSLLPKYRGASPMAAPLIAGDPETGVTLIKMDEELDHGPIIAQEQIAIEPQDRRPDLERKLTELGYEMFKREIKKLENEKVSSIAQNHAKATYTQKLTKNDGFVKISNFQFPISNESPNDKNQKSAQEIFNLFRGLYPWPGIWTLVRVKGEGGRGKEKRLKITDMDLVDGKLLIKKVQLEGKQEVDFTTFNTAYEVF